MNFKPDLLLQYCVYCDYPIYRAWMQKYRDRFGKIIIYPSRHHGVLDLEKFAKQTIPETWVDPVVIDYGVEDWRQAETDPMLKHVTSDWIWFSEQDFFCKDWEKFFADIERESKTNDLMGLWNPTNFPYYHPSCLIIKTEVLNKTNKDFKAHAGINGADHFCMITKDAIKNGANNKSIQNMGWGENKAFHLGGLTYAYQNFKDDFSNPIGVKYPEAFQVYNQMQLGTNVEQNIDFMDLAYRVGDQLQSLHIPLEYDKWEDFFII